MVPVVYYPWKYRGHCHQVILCVLGYALAPPGRALEVQNLSGHLELLDHSLYFYNILIWFPPTLMFERHCLRAMVLKLVCRLESPKELRKNTDAQAPPSEVQIQLV